MSDNRVVQSGLARENNGKQAFRLSRNLYSIWFPSSRSRLNTHLCLMTVIPAGLPESRLQG